MPFAFLAGLALVSTKPAEPKVVASIPPSHRLVEGIATDGKKLWVSSVLDRTILECSRPCRPFAYLPPGHHPLGMTWDPLRSRLWVATDCPKVSGVPLCDRGALLGIDRAGRIRTRVSIAGATFHPGDVSAFHSGVYVSDSGSGAVYALSGDRKVLIPLVPPAEKRSAQGSAAIESGDLVYADYREGLALVDRRTGVRKPLLTDGKPLKGIDGLVRCGPTFYAISNSRAPNRVLTFTIVDGALVGDSFAAGGMIQDLTQLAIDGNRLLVVARSGWDTIGNAASASHGAQVLAFQLADGCG